MEDFRVTEGEPLKQPFACLLCRGNLGQMLDTGRELTGYGRIYLCESCGKQVAAAFGYAKGRRMTQLSQASKEIAQKDAEIADLQAKVIVATAKTDEMTRLAAGLGGELETARQRVAQLEERFIEQAQQARELVVGGVQEGGE